MSLPYLETDLEGNEFDRQNIISSKIMDFHLNFMLSVTGPQDQFTYLKMETRMCFLLIISVKALNKTQHKKCTMI